MRLLYVVMFTTSPMSLADQLREVRYLMSEDQKRTRDEVIDAMKRHFITFLETMHTGTHGKMMLFGSTSLGLCLTMSDIDLVCMVYMTRMAFFESFSEYLKTQPRITYVNVVEAAVPLVRVVMDDFEVDVLHVLWPDNTTPSESDFMSSEILPRLDNEAISSIHGLRLTTFLQSVIPDMEVFRTALHAFRLWTACMYYHVCFYFTRSWFILILPGFRRLRNDLYCIEWDVKL